MGSGGQEKLFRLTTGDKRIFKKNRRTQFLNSFSHECLINIDFDRGLREIQIDFDFDRRFRTGSFPHVWRWKRKENAGGLWFVCFEKVRHIAHGIHGLTDCISSVPSNSKSSQRRCVCVCVCVSVDQQENGRTVVEERRGGGGGGGGSEGQGGEGQNGKGWEGRWAGLEVSTCVSYAFLRSALFLDFWQYFPLFFRLGEFLRWGHDDCFESPPAT